MVLVLGLDLPIAEFLLFLNIAMLFYIVFTMIELRSLRKLRRELTLQLEEIRFLIKSIRFSPAIKDSIDHKTVSIQSKIQKTQPTPSYKLPSRPQKAPPLPELPEVEEGETEE
jgi:hypothetical protein